MVKSKVNLALMA